jgi:membrane protease YdiL (CAAX protease family)
MRALALTVPSAAIVLLATYGVQLMVGYMGTRYALSRFADFRLVTTVVQLILLLAIALVLRAPVVRLAAGKVTTDGLRAAAWFTVGGVMFSLFVSFGIVMSDHRAASELPFSMMLQGVTSEFGVTGVAGQIFVYAVLVPISEELLFRGLILGYLFRRSPAWLGLAITTVLFAIVHPSWLIAGFAGLVYGLLYLRFQSLMLCMIAHGLNNLLTAWTAPLLVAYLAEYGFIVAGDRNLFALQLLWMAVVIACMVLFLRTMSSGAPAGWFKMQPSFARNSASAAS